MRLRTTDLGGPAVGGPHRALSRSRCACRFQRTRGPSHPLTVTARNSLGVLLLALGMVAAARTQLKAVVAIHTVQSGRDGRETLLAKFNLGALAALRRCPPPSRAAAVRPPHAPRATAAAVARDGEDDVAGFCAILREIVETCRRSPQLGEDFAEGRIGASYKGQLALFEPLVPRVEAGQLRFKAKSPWQVGVSDAAEGDDRVLYLNQATMTLQRPEGAAGMPAAVVAAGGVKALEKLPQEVFDDLWGKVSASADGSFALR
eukprot:COSAG01_NODE_2881_length_6915_cov_5.685739_2_plen_261_part_00